ncbi:hypothetical protein JKF63_00241 [Porcisia hertigi]|uniref:FYVE-type domain-containing protein n=1 Tax=Porcisia hertigi TaxID=2761500 RepID=A0A836GXY5_9TRYP|nr:hypothetical protein JKF63_00241 [Porcisia hertigi]
MGKSSDALKPSHRCAVCEHGFSLTLWKHTCDMCRRTVCDDCAPRNTESVDSNGKTTKLRVCEICSTSGRHLGRVVGQDSATNGAPGTGASRLDPNSEAERERRARLIEERNKAQEARGRPQHADGARSTRSVAPGKEHPLAPSLSPPTLSSSPVSTPVTPPPPHTNSGNSECSVNPVLEAAMRRQKQQQVRHSTTASPSAASMSPEKKQLIYTIETLLAKHHEDPPLGLRASEEPKLRVYLQYLRNKYHVNE